jgi:hypothetical protein
MLGLLVLILTCLIVFGFYKMYTISAFSWTWIYGKPVSHGLFESHVVIHEYTWGTLPMALYISDLS